MIFTSLKASVGNYLVSKKDEEQIKLFNLLEVYNYWLVAFCSICFIVLIPDFINICFGEQYILSLPVLIWAVLNFYTSNIRQALWTYRETMGVFKKTKYTTIVTAIINIGLSILLAKFFGLSGVIAATVIARMIYAWWKEPLVIYKDYFKTSPMPYFITYIKRVVLLFAMSGITYIVAIIIPVPNIYINFLLKGIVCIIVPVIIFFIIYRKSEAYIYITNNLIKRKVKNIG